MFKKLVAIYEGEIEVGEVEIICPSEKNWIFLKEIKINYFSEASERCCPLAVLHTITSGNGNGNCCFKMEAKFRQTPDSPLSILHSSCLRDNKTAIMSLGHEELHLVAMRSTKYEGNFPCFWGFIVAPGLYSYCLVLLNLRCLGIVFDLDETLIVANTMRSFEDKIEALQRKINSETDLQRVAGMLLEVKRYQDDKTILKQYADSDQVVDSGKVFKSQSEIVPALSDSHQPITRPLIRLQDKNIILTRINPQIRDTSVLVRLRPAWEDIRSYLTARGRKRFEVYVCTMAERDYALEMWRLLDPESNLINPKELLDRIVCVKSGSRKSLFNVFQDRNCHPKMALVIDDRLKVWDEADQPRVHVVPAFAPYYAPEAEANNTVPVLCVARNVACNVRGGFFKDFDDSLLQQVVKVSYEDNIEEIRSPPDVSNYLVSEDDASVGNGNKQMLGFDGMADAEVEKIMKEAILAASGVQSTIANPDPRITPNLQLSTGSSSTTLPSTLAGSGLPFPIQQLTQGIAAAKPPLTQINSLETTSLHSSPAREEGEVPECELDPDTRRRLLILQHGQDMRDLALGEPQFPVRPPPVQVPMPRIPSRSWVPIEQEMSPRQLSREVPAKDFLPNADEVHFEKQQPQHGPFMPKVDSSMAPDRVVESQRLLKEPQTRGDCSRLNQPIPPFQSFTNEEASMARPSSGHRDLEMEPGRIDPYAETPVGVLQDIAFRCGTKVDFKSALVATSELQFSVEVWFAGEKIGKGIGRTRREAHRQAAEGSLMNLADKFLSRPKPDSAVWSGHLNRFPITNNNGFLNDANSLGYQMPLKEDVPSFPNQSEPSRVLDPRLEASKRSMGPIAALKEICALEGLALAFQTQPQFAANPGQKAEVFAQVEIDGQILGKGRGQRWEVAKAQASETALGALGSMLGHYPHKRHTSPRPWSGFPNKRVKPEYSRVLQRMPTSSRYPNNASPVL
ncbi:protein phosphatase [Lithospermum erythrorhizon]|uniref:protein-serine/threonine phosphatase n=1 Tax=Lithospermum erythrorhizon TaxID=34254 RepID=A0AAV3QB10_LITER